MAIQLNNFTVDVDADGIATAVWDMQDRSMNVITNAVMDDLEKLIDHVSGEAGIKGCVVTSGKDSFSAGADLTMLQASAGEYAKLIKTKGEDTANQFLLDTSARLTRIYRRLETCGKPFAAAVHGTCLGGAFELALACHFRVLSDDAKTRSACPRSRSAFSPAPVARSASRA